MNEEEMIYYEDELLEELSKNKQKRTDILIDLNVALQKYQRLSANIKNVREIQEYKIAVVSVESELKELQEENKQLKKRLEKIDNILNYCKFEIEKEKDKFPCPLESEQWLKGRISAFEEILQVEKSDK